MLPGNYVKSNSGMVLVLAFGYRVFLSQGFPKQSLTGDSGRTTFHSNCCYKHY